MRRALPLVLLILAGSSPVAVQAAPAAAPRPLTSYSMHALEDVQHATERLTFAPATGEIIPRQARAAIPTATNPLLRREVFGFAPYWNLSKHNEWNFNLLSTIAYFGLNVNPDGTFATQGPGWDGWNSADLTAIINKAHAAGGRVVLVIKTFNDGTINQVLTTGARQNLVNQTVAAIASKNMDGVNVDFEASGDPRFPDIPVGITTLMTELSAAVHARWPSAQVSIDTYAGSASWDGGIFKIGDLAPVVDAFFIMAYDSVFSNMPGQAGPNSPLNGWTYNSTIDVAQYLTKAPASKIILGVPYYGYRWSTVDGSLYSTVISGGKAVTYTGAMQNLACGAIALKTGWDPLGQSPWASWWSPRTGDPCTDNLASPQQMYYDDAASLGLKYDLVNSNNLRGAGMWTLGYDSGYQDLWNELALKFTTTTPWFPLNGVLASGPTASSWSKDRVDSFVQGTNGGLWQTTWNGTAWSGWGTLGGILTSAPGAVSWGKDRIDVFGRGSDSALWHIWWDGVKWSGWEHLGGGLTSSPDVSSWGVGRLDIFVRGNDYGLWHKWWDSAGWHQWEALGGILTSDPSVVASTNRVDVFGRGTDNALWHKWWDTAGWHQWERLGGVLSSGPSAASCTAGHIDVFAVGADPAMYQIGYNGNTWQPWQRLGGQWTADPGAVCPTGATSVELFARGPDSGLWHTKVPAS